MVIPANRLFEHTRKLSRSIFSRKRFNSDQFALRICIAVDTYGGKVAGRKTVVQRPDLSPKGMSLKRGGTIILAEVEMLSGVRGVLPILPRGACIRYGSQTGVVDSLFSWWNRTDRSRCGRWTGRMLLAVDDRMRNVSPCRGNLRPRKGASFVENDVLNLNITEGGDGSQLPRRLGLCSR